MKRTPDPMIMSALKFYPLSVPDMFWSVLHDNFKKIISSVQEIPFVAEVCVIFARRISWILRVVSIIMRIPLLS